MVGFLSSLFLHAGSNPAKPTCPFFSLQLHHLSYLYLAGSVQPQDASVLLVLVSLSITSDLLTLRILYQVLRVQQ